MRGHSTTGGSGKQHKAVAVLYFNNLTQDPSLNWLDNGLTDMLTTNLAQVKGLLTQNFDLPAGIAPNQIANPPEIRFHIGADGTLSDIKLVKTSGNSFVDDACVSSAQTTRKVPPPPPSIHGIRVACEKS